MTLAIRAILRLSPLVLATGLGCDDRCEPLCLEDYDDCTYKDQSGPCDYELERCRAACAAEPTDFGHDGWPPD
jgi:hypothetical protein